MLSNLLATYAIDTAEPMVLWLTVAVVAALVIAGIIVYAVLRKTEKEKASKIIKYLLLEFVFYALVVGIVMLILQLTKYMNYDYLDAKYVSRDIIPYVLVPLLVFFGIILIGSAGLCVLYKFKRSLFKPFAIALGALIIVGVIVCGITIGTFYFNHIAEDGYYNGNELKGTDIKAHVDQLALYLSAAGLVIAAVTGALVLGRKDKTAFDSRCIALAGITIAMSFVLSYIKLWEMPQGGSITLVSLLPIMIFAYIYGPKKGVLVGFIYGIMQAMQDPYIIHPAQFFLDYPIAFAMVGFAGVFKKITALDKLPQVKFVLGAIVASALRFFAHVLSGVFAFGAYAIDAGQSNFWTYSLAYNSFVFVDIALVLVAGAIVLSSKAFVRQLDRYASAATLKTQSAEEPATTEEQ